MSNERLSPEAEPRAKGNALALSREETRAAGKLTVSSSAFSASGTVPLRHSEYGERISPDIRWSGAPAGTVQLAMLMEDPDATVGLPFVHWIVWNIPGSATGLVEALPTDAQLASPRGLRQGRNSRGSLGYFGPRPPVGDKAHHYHFQLFALDAPVELLPGAGREELLAAMSGHVLAKGELVGTFGQARPPEKR